MTPAGNGQSVFHRVIMSEVTRTTILALQQQLLLAGRGPQFLAAFRQIVEQLRLQPLIFGEALDRLPTLQLQVRRAWSVPWWWTMRSMKTSAWFSSGT
jgi:hypothetical protein